MPAGINLTDLFNTAARAIQSNQVQLNRADSINGNHGDHMVEIFDVITQAMREKKTADAPAQLEYAAQLLRQRSASGSAKVIANGLAQEANQVTGNAIPLESALSVLQTLLNGGKSETGSTAPGLASGVVGAEGGKPKGVDWLGVGLNLLKASKEAGIDFGALAQSLVSGTEMGKSEHRSQSGQLITNAILKTLFSDSKM